MFKHFQSYDLLLCNKIFYFWGIVAYHQDKLVGFVIGYKPPKKQDTIFGRYYYYYLLLLLLLLLLPLVVRWLLRSTTNRGIISFYIICILMYCYNVQLYTSTLSFLYYCYYYYFFYCYYYYY